MITKVNSMLAATLVMMSVLSGRTALKVATWASRYDAGFHRFIADTSGASSTQTRNNIIVIITGVVTILIGMIVSNIITTQAETNGQDASLGSFTGAQSVNDLQPLIIQVVVLIVGVSMIGLGTKGLAASAG